MLYNNTNFKNERRILIGYWLAQQLHNATSHTCTTLCVWSNEVKARAL